jgi:hypothetical protein
MKMNHKIEQSLPKHVAIALGNGKGLRLDLMLARDCLL